jgi:hypothetical protein
MNKIAKEILLFFLFSYLAVWICFPVLTAMNLKASSPVWSPLEETYLIQLFLFVWMLILAALYATRLVIFFVIKKLE